MAAVEESADKEPHDEGDEKEVNDEVNVSHDQDHQHDQKVRRVVLRPALLVGLVVILFVVDIVAVDEPGGVEDLGKAHHAHANYRFLPMGQLSIVKHLRYLMV